MRIVVLIGFIIGFSSCTTLMVCPTKEIESCNSEKKWNAKARNLTPDSCIELMKEYETKDNVSSFICL
jgi:hypothetical protein